VRCRNRRVDVLAAERLVSAAQILTVELLDQDLVLMPTRIDIFVEARAAGDADLGAHDLPSNDGRRWKVMLTAYDGPNSLDHTHTETLAALASILIEASLLPQQAFFDALNIAFERGLSHKLHTGRPYDELAAILDDTHFDDTAVQYGQPLGPPADHPARPAPQVEAVTRPGPTYSRAEAERMVRNRYEIIPPVVALTLLRLKQDRAFQAVIAELRRRGWLDWHLLVGISSIVATYRMRLAGALDRFPTADEKAEIERIVLQPETADLPAVPLSLFTLQGMEEGRQIAMLKLVEHWKLEAHQPTPDFQAINTVLAERYGYWVDDVPHDDPFGANPGPATPA
jgi:hypothetical protein